MAYEKIGFSEGQILKAEHLNHMEEGIAGGTKIFTLYGHSKDDIYSGIKFSELKKLLQNNNEIIAILTVCDYSSTKMYVLNYFSLINENMIECMIDDEHMLNGHTSYYTITENESYGNAVFAFTEGGTGLGGGGGWDV